MQEDLDDIIGNQKLKERMMRKEEAVLKMFRKKKGKKIQVQIKEVRQQEKDQ